MPSHDTFGRVFAGARHRRVPHRHASVGRSVRRIAAGPGDHDRRKTLKGSFDQAADQSPLHDHGLGRRSTRLVLRQLSVDEKSNEIPAVPVLLTLLELEGRVVTLDAMHCRSRQQGDHQAKADVMTVKQEPAATAPATDQHFEQYARRTIRSTVFASESAVTAARTAADSGLLRHPAYRRRPGALAWPSVHSRSGCSAQHDPPTSRAKRKEIAHDVASSSATLPPTSG
ncbi:MAG: ISAs1 family transposase [Planctomycetaceae bacterium]